MKAMVYRDFGSPDVLRCEDIPIPVPADDQVLVRVIAASVNPLDWRLMQGGLLVFRLVMGLHKPKHPGVDVAGIVEATGRSVTQFHPGDEVFGTCKGAFAEYACAPASTLALKPPGVSFEQAAAIPIAGLTALQGLRNKGGIRAGHRVLINGAAGGVGTFAVQIAKVFGSEVTGVCSTHNLDMVRSLGADCVIDYTQEDFTRLPERYDLVVECVGNRPFPACRRILSRTGLYVAIGASKEGLPRVLAGLLHAFLLSLFVTQRFIVFIAKSNQQDLATLAGLVASGKVTPVLDRCYPLAELADAVRYQEQGHARGKVVVSVASGCEPPARTFATSESAPAQV